MVKGPGHGPYVDIAQVPGRHIPFDFLVDIPIRDGETDTQQGTLQVTMEGPFVATHRMAVFRSQQTFRVQGETTAAFNGRSFGRFRPIHSAGDIMDAMRAFEQPGTYQPSYLGAVWDGATYVPIGNPMGVFNNAGNTGAVNTNPLSQPNAPPPFPGNGTPLYESPIAMAAFRTMEMDATIVVEVQGSNFQRSNIGVPSTFWSKFLTDPWDLPTLDVYEPGESVVVKVTPTHPTNAAFGNIGGLVIASNTFAFSTAVGAAVNNPAENPSLPAAGGAGIGLPTGGWPFLQGQYDGHEGIDGRTLLGDTGTTPDRVTRSNDGILTIGFAGFRIVQAPQMMR
jgi:hypothetical protein